MNSFSLIVFLLPATLLFVLNCAKVDTPEPSHVKYGGVCSDEYSKAYESILNLPDGSDIQVACDDFYTNYSGIKCVSNLNGVEFRLHTTDFDKKCMRNLIPVENAGGRQPRTTDSDAKLKDACPTEVNLFLTEKEQEFQKFLNELNSKEVSEEYLFQSSLSKKKACNQYFFNYKYLDCPVADKRYSFYTLKPFCDEFGRILHQLKIKNPKKYSPEELKPLNGLNLKFRFNDAFLNFYKPGSKEKNSYIVDGFPSTFGNITSSQNYCLFESEKISFSGELKNEIYKVDFLQPNKNKFIFAHTSFNEQWRLVCIAREHFYFQDLIETLGNKVLVIN